MSRQFREIVPRREQEPHRDRWLRTEIRRTGNWCNAAYSSTLGGSSFAANRQRCRSMAGRKSAPCPVALTVSPPNRILPLSPFTPASSFTDSPRNRISVPTSHCLGLTGCAESRSSCRPSHSALRSANRRPSITEPRRGMVNRTEPSGRKSVCRKATRPRQILHGKFPCREFCVPPIPFGWHRKSPVVEN